MHSAYIERTIGIEVMGSSIDNDHGMLTRHQGFGQVKGKSWVGKKIEVGSETWTNYGGLCRKSKGVKGCQVLVLCRSLCWACCLTVLSPHPGKEAWSRRKQAERMSSLPGSVILTLFAPFPQRIRKLYYLTYGNLFLILSVNKLIFIKM